uniref:Uncharacterized protein n=1 Tax=Strongyloides venezuelensis TaxID=75913 RepID=A0A0K0FMZ0_STRVS
MPSLNARDKRNSKNQQIGKNYEKLSINSKMEKNNDVEYDDNFDDGIVDKDIIIKEENLNKKTAVSSAKKSKESKSEDKAAEKIRRSLNDQATHENNNQPSPQKPGDNSQQPSQIHVSPSQTQEALETFSDQSQDNKLGKNNSPNNIVLYAICCIIASIIFVAVFLIIYMCYKKKAKSKKKKTSKKKKKVAKNAREEGAANRRKPKEQKQKEEEKKKKKVVHESKDLKQEKVIEVDKMLLHTAVPNEINVEKPFLPSNPINDNLQLKNNVPNHQYVINDIPPDNLLYDFSDQSISDQTFNLLNNNPQMSAKKCCCDKNSKAKTTLYTQRGNQVEWKTIKEENACDDFSFQISSSFDETSKVI